MKRIPSIKIALLLLCITFGMTAQAQVTNINTGWTFALGNQVDDTLADARPIWQKVNLPHCFNTLDAFDDKEGYYRGPTTYIKTVSNITLEKNKRIYIKIGAANQKSTLYCNNVLVGEHVGGYLAFCTDLSPHWQDGDNIISIVVDNSHDEFIIPLKGDFTFYGGIYRDVELIIKNEISFDIETFANDGIYVHSPENNEQNANVILKAHVKNPKNRKVELTVKVFDANDSLVYENLKFYMHTHDYPYLLDKFDLELPRLWSIEDPHQYRLLISIDSANVNYDKTELKFGIRTFKFDADEGFFLNGKYTKLIGVNRHQDRPGKGNALSKADHLEDMEIMHSMGINFLRTAHYPQDKSILEYCDANGIIVSMETPLDHEITDHPTFYQNCVDMQVKMIKQYYNHPSIVIWAYMNEMFLGKKWDRDSTVIKKTTAFAHVLDSICRKTDPTRYTMIPNHGDFEVYQRSGIMNIPMIVGWNLYYGWYEPNFKDFGKFIDHAHKKVNKPIIVTEYGAGADPRLRSFKPVRFDFSQDWTIDFHNAHIDQINQRKYISGAAVWNMFDFGSESRVDAVPHINNKGLAGFDRKPKDVFYVYQSALTDGPVFSIPFSSNLRFPILGSKVELPLRLPSNLDSIDITINSGSKTRMKRDGFVHRSYPQLGVGAHTLQYAEANSNKKLGKQQITILDYKDMDSLCINFGADLYLFESSNRVWIPFEVTEHIKAEGQGLNRFMPRDRGVGSNHAISNTDLDPIFQTAIRNVERIQIPLKNGGYIIKFHFAPISKLDIGKSMFAITIATDTISVKLSDPKLAYRPTTERIEITIDNELLDVSFKPLVGETFINAMEIIKK